uniref:Uncharacterized protein n=1 Tax=Anguilla anguilla TaxID=7936 RepID=A0A0E9SGQ8_ANGAN
MVTDTHAHTHKQTHVHATICSANYSSNLND